MEIKEHDWRTKDQRYVQADTQLADPERYEWSEPLGADQRIITRGIARKGAKLEVLNCQTEIETDGGERLQVSIKEAEPTAIFLNESRLAWQRRQGILSDEEGIIRDTGRFSADEREFDFLQASQTAVIMAIAGVECYANIKISQLRKGGRANKQPRKGGKLAGRQKLNLEKKIDEALSQMTKRGQPSKSTNIKCFWKDFENINGLRNELIHANATGMEAVTINRPSWANTWDKTSRIVCPHEMAIRLIEYFEDDKPKWLEKFPKSMA